MTCHSKWCSTITAISQLAVTSVIVYAGLVVGSHMESWSESFKQGSDDLHSIRQNMNQMTYSMESINRDMTTMNNTTLAMEKHIHELNDNITVINKQMYLMNGSVSNMANKFSPRGMARSFMPF
jgi:CHAD domain-containing protein